MSKKILTYSIIGSFLIFTGIQTETSSLNKENHSLRIEKFHSVTHINLTDDKTSFKSFIDYYQNNENFFLINIFNLTNTINLLEQIYWDFNSLRFTLKNNSTQTRRGFNSTLKI